MTAAKQCERCDHPLTTTGDDAPYCARCFLGALMAEQPEEVDGQTVQASYGPYRCVELLGEGGMGRVWKAWDTDLSRWVALKLVKGRDPQLLARFERESKLIAKLGGHTNIAQVFAADERDGQPFIAMQLIAGVTLEAYAGAAPRDIARLGRDAARGVAHAHAHGVVHRDLKPANVMVETDAATPPRVPPTARVFVMDFGLARTASTGASISRPGDLLGTPEFMSPEHVLGTPTDPRSDVYSLGATLYATLTGRPPFRAPEVTSLFRQIVEEEPPPPRLLRPDLPRDLETIVNKCLAKEPQRRYAHAGELADDLTRLLEREPVLARPPSLSYLLSRRLSKHRRTLAAAGVTLALAVLGYLLGVTLPARRRAERDRALLRPALAAKRAAETRFAEELAAGACDRAVELGRPLFGRRPPLPELADPSVALEPEFAELGEDYAVALPRALRELGLQRLASGDPRGKSDLANAYRLARDRSDQEDEALAALLDLASQLLDEGAFSDAAGAAGIAAARFGQELPLTRATLARTLQQTGKLPGAVAFWEGLVADPELGEEARRQLSVLTQWLPTRRLPLPPGRHVWGDVDGDGDPELVAIDEDWTARLLSPEPEGWREVAAVELKPPVAGPPADAFLLDPQGNGRLELFVFGGAAPPQPTAFVWARLVDGEWLPGAHQQSSGELRDATLADLDADGQRELLAWTNWPLPELRVYRCSAEGPRLWCTWNTISQVQSVLEIEPGRLLVFLGHWKKTTRGSPVYRLGVDGVAYEGEETRPWGYRVFTLERGPDGAFREGSASPANYAKGSLSRLDADTFCVRSWTPQTRRVIVPEAVEGLHRIRDAAGTLSAPEPLDARGVAGRIEAQGRSWQVYELPEGRLAVRDRRGGEVGFVGPARRVAGSRPPVFLQTQGSDVTLFGLGAYRVPPIPQLAPEEAVASQGSLTPGQELLEIGLYEEATSVLRASLAERPTPRAHYDLGVALDRLGRDRLAADAYAEASRDRSLAPNALLRRGHCLERLRAWRDLETCVSKLLELPSADGLARAWAEEHRWVREAGRGVQRTVLADWRALPLLVQNPFKVRIGDDLEVWSSSEGREGAGVLFPYRGGTLRLRLRFVAEQIEWATGASVGLERLRAPGEAISRLQLGEMADGASDLPTRTLMLDAYSGSGHRPYFDARLTYGAEHVAELEHVDGVGRVFARVLDADGQPLTSLEQADLKLPLQGGAYVLGSPGMVFWRYEDNGATTSRLLLKSIAVETGKAWTVPEGFEPRSPEQALAWANGLALRGRVAQARAVYGELLATSPLPQLRSRALMFRALLALRAGDPAAAEADVRAAREADLGVARALISERRAPALAAGELELLRSFLASG